MRRWCRLISVCPHSHAARLAVTFAVAPVLALSPLSAEAILIHYDGHDVHTHTVGFTELDSWVEAAGHEHAAHDHDCQLRDPHGHGSDFLVVLDLPDAVLRVRGLGSGAVIVASSALVPSSAVVSAAAAGNGAPLPPRSSLLASTLHPNRTVVGILLSNHALLL